MAASESYLNIWSKDKTHLIVTVYDYEFEKSGDNPTIGQILATQACISYGITELTNLSGEILSHSAYVSNCISPGDSDGANLRLYDATPEPEPQAETVTGFYLDGQEYKFDGGGGGDMSYSDFGWQAKTGATITLDLASTYTPSANFTVNAPATIKDGQTYILRVNNGSTAYTMTLGTNVTNPFDTDITLTANGIDQFVFLAINGELELQPEGGGGGGDGFILAPNSPLTPKYFWYGTQAQYDALTQYYTDEENDTVYFTI